MTITWEDFEKVEMRVGKIIKVEDFLEAKHPAYKLLIDFGPELGTKKSSAQLTQLYKKENLLGKQVICVVNFKPKQIGNFISECLTMGIYDKKGVVLLQPEQETELGAKIG